MHIVICSSANFYRKANELKDVLEEKGHKVILPATAEIMRKNNDFEVSHYKTWFKDSDEYHKKTKLMRQHLDKISDGDAILVINNEKNKLKNYIGGNVLMEMSLAFYLHKPIYLLNDFPLDSPFLEEVIGMDSIPLRGNILNLPTV